MRRASRLARCPLSATMRNQVAPVKDDDPGLICWPGLRTDPTHHLHIMSGRCGPSSSHNGQATITTRPRHLHPRDHPAPQTPYTNSLLAFNSGTRQTTRLPLQETKGEQQASRHDHHTVQRPPHRRGRDQLRHDRGSLVSRTSSRDLADPRRRDLRGASPPQVSVLAHAARRSDA